MHIRLHMPDWVYKFTYQKNSHFIEFEDKKGSSLKLDAVGLLRGKCTLCHQVFFVTSKIGNMACPHCAGKVKWAWGKLQVGFVPDHESNFIETFELKEK